MALDRYKQEFALVKAHYGCFGQRRIIRVPIFHLGLPQVKLYLSTGAASVFWIQAARGSDAAALNYAERYENGVRNFKVDSIKVHVRWHTKTSKDGSACDLELSPKDQALIKVLYQNTRREWGKLQGHTKLLEIIESNRLCLVHTPKDIVLTSADGEILGRISPDMGTGKLLFKTPASSTKVDCRTADDVVKAVAKAAAAVQCCSKERLRLLRALRTSGKPQQDALEQLSSDISNGLAAEWSKAGVQLELVQVAKQQNSSSGSSIMRMVEEVAQRALEHASAAGLKHYMGALIAALHSSHAAGASSWGLLRLLHASLALSNACQAANALDMSAALVLVLQELAPRRQQQQAAAGSDDVRSGRDNYKASSSSSEQQQEERIRNDAFTGLDAEDASAILAAPAPAAAAALASPSRFASQQPGSPGSTLVRKQRGTVMVPKLVLPAQQAVQSPGGGLSLVHSNRLSRRGTSEGGSHRPAADAGRKPKQLLLQMGRSTGENLIASLLPSFYRHKEERQQGAGHLSRRSSAAGSARRIVLEPPRDDCGVLQPTDPRLPVHAQCKLLALLCLRALSEGGCAQLPQPGTATIAINPLALLATELVAPEAAGVQQLQQLEAAVALRLVRYLKQVILDYLVAAAAAAAKEEACSSGRLLAHFADQLQSYAAPQHLADSCFQEASALLQLLRSYVARAPAAPAVVSACLCQCGEALARLEHRLRGAGRLALWGPAQYALLQALLDLACCIMDSELQAPAAALLLRSLASQDAVQLACDAVRVLWLEQVDSKAGGADSVAVLITIWRFLGKMLRFTSQHKDIFRSTSNPSSAHRLLLETGKSSSSAAALHGDMLILGSATGSTTSSSSAAAASSSSSGSSSKATSSSPVPALTLSAVTLNPSSPKPQSASSQRSAHSGMSQISLSLHGSVATGSSSSGSSSRGSRFGVPVLSEWLQPMAALVEPPASLAAAHLEKAPSCFARLQLQLQVLDFLATMFGSSEQQQQQQQQMRSDYFVHLHSTGFIRAYHALPSALSEPLHSSRSVAGRKGQPQLQLCIGHLKVLLALCRSAGPDTRRRFYQMSLLDSLVQELRLELDMFCNAPGRQQEPPAPPALSLLERMAMPAAADSPPASDTEEVTLSDSSDSPGQPWLRGFDLEEDCDALSEHEAMYGEVERLGFTPTHSRPTSSSSHHPPDSSSPPAAAAAAAAAGRQLATPPRMRTLDEDTEQHMCSSDCSSRAEEEDRYDVDSCSSDGWGEPSRQLPKRPYIPPLRLSKSEPLLKRPVVPPLAFQLPPAAAAAAAPSSSAAAAGLRGLLAVEDTPHTLTTIIAAPVAPPEQQQHSSSSEQQPFPRIQLAGISTTLDSSLVVIGNSSVAGAADSEPPSPGPLELYHNDSPTVTFSRLVLGSSGGIHHTPPSLPSSASPGKHGAGAPPMIVFTGDLDEDAERLELLEERGCCLDAQLGFSDCGGGSESCDDDSSETEQRDTHRDQQPPLAAHPRKPPGSRPLVPSLRLNTLKLPPPLGAAAAAPAALTSPVTPRPLSTVQEEQQQAAAVYNPLHRRSLRSYPVALDTPPDAAGISPDTHRPASARAQDTSRALQQRDAERLRAYSELRCASALYADPQLHALVLEFALLLMLDSSGQLDPANMPQDGTDQRLQNLFLALFYHLSYRENVEVVDAVWRAVKEGGGAAVLTRLLKLSAAGLFACQLESHGELGRGAYATIMGARQLLEDGSSRAVAVKVLPVAQERQSHDCTNFAKVYSEVAVLEALAATPGVARLLDYGVVHSAAANHNSFQLVFQRYRCSLKEWRLRLTHVTAATHIHLFLAVFLQVVRTVESVHARGIIHFDLKGENVLLEPRAGVSEQELFNPPPRAQPSQLPFDTYLADFGESVAYQCAEGAFTQRPRGTECFQSPEMLLLGAGAHNKEHQNYDRRRHRGVGAKHDVWALGCLLYELLTGKYLFIRPECNAQMSDAGVWVRVTQGGDGPERLTAEERACLCGHPAAVQLLQQVLRQDPSMRPAVGDLARMVEERLAAL